MKGVFDMKEPEFKTHLNQLTTPGELLENAGRIYDYLAEIFKQSCSDSLLREWAFQWYADKTGNDYDVIYDKWLEEA